MSKGKKTEARQIPMGKCGHKITRIKRSNRFEWWCYDACNGPAAYSHIKLQARGKAK
jgi:hypothetical protein